jgi:hypothetical protein
MIEQAHALLGAFGSAAKAEGDTADSAGAMAMARQAGVLYALAVWCQCARVP